MSAAISPYSIAVAPASSERNFENVDFIVRAILFRLPRLPFLRRHAP
jgi:hypothetical protein